MNSEIYKCSEETFKRYEELKDKIGSQVFYNGETYKIADIMTVLDPISISKLPIIQLVQTKQLMIKGEDISNIKDAIITKQTIHCKDGSVNIKFEKIPYEGQELNEHGVVDLGEINE